MVKHVCVCVCAEICGTIDNIGCVDYCRTLVRNTTGFYARLLERVERSSLPRRCRLRNDGIGSDSANNAESK